MSQIDYVRREEQFDVIESMARRSRVPWDRRCRVARSETNPRSLVGARRLRGTGRNRQRSPVVEAKPALVGLDEPTVIIHNQPQAEHPRAQLKGWAPQ